MNKDNITLNGYYKDDFKEKQKVIKILLEEKGIEYEQVNLLMDGKLHKFCSKEKINNGHHFYYSW